MLRIFCQKSDELIGKVSKGEQKNEQLLVVPAGLAVRQMQTGAKRAEKGEQCCQHLSVVVTKLSARRVQPAVTISTLKEDKLLLLVFCFVGLISSFVPTGLSARSLTGL